MIGVDIKVEGLRELDRQLSSLSASVGSKVLRGALMDSATPLVKEMKERVPVANGNLKRTIGKRSSVNRRGERNQATAVVSVGAVRKGSWKAHFVEFGTSRNRAQPFIRPALDATQDKVLSRFKERLKKRIEKVTLSD